ncbi:MAG: hypothetical protein EA344_13340, partial [Alkalicoccus sp.]
MVDAENFASALPWRRYPSAFYDSYFFFRKTGDRAETPAEKESGKILPAVREAAGAAGEKAAGTPKITRSFNRAYRKNGFNKEVFHNRKLLLISLLQPQG